MNVNKLMWSTLLTVGLLCITATASAWTCKPGDWKYSECGCKGAPVGYPACTKTPPPTNSAPSSTDSQTQTQSQNQSSNSNSNASGGVGVGLGVGVGGNSTASSNSQGGAGGQGGQGGTGGVSDSKSNATGGSVGATTALAANGGNKTTSKATGGRAEGGSVKDVKSSSASKSSSYSGGNQTSSASETSSDADAANSGGNSAVSVDASDHRTINDNERTTFIPAVIPPTPSTQLGVGTVTTVIGACGPMQTVVHSNVQGKYMGFFRTKDVLLGTDDTLEPYVDANGYQVQYLHVPQPDGSVALVGTQPIFFTTVVGVAGGRNLALGGGGESKWGQAGGGATSNYQRLVIRIELRQCQIGEWKTAAPTTPKAYTLKHIRQ